MSACALTEILACARHISIFSSYRTRKKDWENRNAQGETSAPGEGQGTAPAQSGGHGNAPAQSSKYVLVQCSATNTATYTRAPPGVIRVDGVVTYRSGFNASTASSSAHQARRHTSCCAHDHHDKPADVTTLATGQTAAAAATCATLGGIDEVDEAAEVWDDDFFESRAVATSIDGLDSMAAEYMSHIMLQCADCLHDWAAKPMDIPLSVLHGTSQSNSASCAAGDHSA